MDREKIKNRIEKIIQELVDGKNFEIVGELTIDVLEIDDLALIKGNKIYFSEKVSLLSDEALKYVIAHELAHLAVKRHTDKFWEILKNLYPDFERGKREVEELWKKINVSLLEDLFMKYWFCITTEDNWKVIRDKNVWGVPERHKNIIAKVKPGDKLLIYAKQEKIGDELKESRGVAIYEVLSEVFRDSKKIFKTPKGMGNEVFPYRIKIKPIKIFSKPIEFKPLIPKLKFISNKRKWSGHLMGKAMREIPKEDFELIVQSE